MDWMAISGYRLPHQIGGGTAPNNQNNQNDLVKREIIPDNINPASSSSSTTMLDMWAASKVEAANSNSNSSSTMGAGSAPPPPTPPPIITGGGGGVNERSSSTGSISTPGSIKGRKSTDFSYLGLVSIFCTVFVHVLSLDLRRVFCGLTFDLHSVLQ